MVTRRAAFANGWSEFWSLMMANPDLWFKVGALFAAMVVLETAGLALAIATGFAVWLWRGLMAHTLGPPHGAVEAAIVASLSSPCRSQRGAALFFEGRTNGTVISVGYNHQPGDVVCDHSAVCKATCRKTAIHAEQSAIYNAAGRIPIGAELLHVKTVKGTLVFSGPPSCLECSKLALVAGIAAVWLFETDGWQRYPAEEFHRRAAVIVTGLEPYYG